MHNTSTPIDIGDIHSEVASVSAGLMDYVAMARPDNWVKNVFMMLFALTVYIVPLDVAFYSKLAGGPMSTCLVASAVLS